MASSRPETNTEAQGSIWKHSQTEANSMKFPTETKHFHQLESWSSDMLSRFSNNDEEDTVMMIITVISAGALTCIRRGGNTQPRLKWD